MSEFDDPEVTDLLGKLRYTPPALGALWRPDPSTRRRPRGLWLAGMVAAVILVVGGTAFAGTQNWFAHFFPSNACVTGDPSCGADYHQVGMVADHVTNLVALNVLVKPNLSHDRLAAIASDLAAQQHASRVIVYLLGNLPQGPEVAGFLAMPEDPAEPAPPPLAALAPYLQLTYDVGPGGAVFIWP